MDLFFRDLALGHVQAESENHATWQRNRAQVGDQGRPVAAAQPDLAFLRTTAPDIVQEHHMLTRYAGGKEFADVHAQQVAFFVSDHGAGRRVHQHEHAIDVRHVDAYRRMLDIGAVAFFTFAQIALKCLATAHLDRQEIVAITEFIAIAVRLDHVGLKPLRALAHPENEQGGEHQDDGNGTRQRQKEPGSDVPV